MLFHGKEIADAAACQLLLDHFAPDVSTTLIEAKRQFTLAEVTDQPFRAKV